MSHTIVKELMQVTGVLVYYNARYVKNTQNGGRTAWNEQKKDMY